MSSNEQILQQIDDLVASKTFGLDALEGIKKVKDSLKATLEERDSLRRRYDALNESHSIRSDEIMRLRSVESGLRQELADSKQLNEAGQKAIYESDKHQAVADAWRSAMAMVFKPNAVRESIQRNHTVMVPTPNGSGYAQAVSNQDHIVREDA